MKFLVALFLCLVTLAQSCYYTVSHSEGTKISSPQIQAIKLGETTEVDLLQLMGPPSKKEQKPDGRVILHYIHSRIESPTFPGGYSTQGFLDKQEKETFEIVLKEGVVENFYFLKQ